MRRILKLLLPKDLGPRTKQHGARTKESRKALDNDALAMLMRPIISCLITQGVVLDGRDALLLLLLLPLLLPRTAFTVRQF